MNHAVRYELRELVGAVKAAGDGAIAPTDLGSHLRSCSNGEPAVVGYDNGFYSCRAGGNY